MACTFQGRETARIVDVQRYGHYHARVRGVQGCARCEAKEVMTV